MYRTMLAVTAALGAASLAAESYQLSIESVRVEGSFIRSIIRIDNRTPDEVGAFRVQCAYIDSQGRALAIEEAILPGALPRGISYGEVLGRNLPGIVDVQCRCRIN